MINRKCFTIVVLLLCFCALAKAQKLPQTQINSLKLPANSLIDGQAVEWSEQYQAYNKATEIFYSIANNDSNLYLIIHAAKPRIIEKILEGGVGFSISGNNKKAAGKSIEVVFPLLTMPIAKGILTTAGKSLTGMTINNKGEDITDSLNQVAKDKLSNSLDKANKQLVNNLKEIKVLGFNASDTIAGITDKTPYYSSLPLRRHKHKVIPIVNKEGINAMIQFDTKGELTSELSIPLEYVKDLDIGSDGKLYYSIIIHGRGEDGRPGNTLTRNAGGAQNQDMEYATDFSGEYILIK